MGACCSTQRQGKRGKGAKSRTASGRLPSSAFQDPQSLTASLNSADFEDYQSCRDAFSFAGSGGSSRSTSPGRSIDGPVAAQRAARRSSVDAAAGVGKGKRTAGDAPRRRDSSDGTDASASSCVTSPSPRPAPDGGVDKCGVGKGHGLVQGQGPLPAEAFPRAVPVAGLRRSGSGRGPSPPRSSAQQRGASPPRAGAQRGSLAGAGGDAHTNHARQPSGCLPDLLEAIRPSAATPSNPQLHKQAPLHKIGSGRGGTAGIGAAAAAGAGAGAGARSLTADGRAGSQAVSVDAAPDARKLDAGCSLKWRNGSSPETSAAGECEPADPTHFKVRSVDYSSSKQKINSGRSLYELVAADAFSTETKLDHVASMTNLPHFDGPALTTPSGTVLPQLLVINLQIPLYGAALWGKSDGHGASVVFYFRLRPDLNPDTFENRAALELFERFVTDGTEQDGSVTRDRFKLIGRVVNVEEWAKEAHLSAAENRLLNAYNEKPLLTRPQHRFYIGANYLEVDIDIHSYSYIARKAFHAYTNRLGPVVWENAFVVQGNSSEELPEQVLAAARIYRIDLANLQPRSSFLTAPS